MITEPQTKRAIAFFDGQNLFHQSKAAFGYTFPNYDALALARATCADRGWRLAETRFYTGVPDARDNAFWHAFWAAKLAAMGKRGGVVYSRPLRYRNKTVRLPDGSDHSFLVGEEKGVDVRMALDIVSLARQRAYDVALVFSQDQDLSEAAEEIRVIAREQQRWIKIVSAFPDSPATNNHRGINKTDWIRIDRIAYDRCVDRADYRPKKPA